MEFLEFSLKARCHCTPEADRLTPPHGCATHHIPAHDPLPLSPFSSRTDQSLREKKGERGKGQCACGNGPLKVGNLTISMKSCE